MATSIQCCLKDCQLGHLTPCMQHVEVKSFTSEADKDKEGLFKIVWQEDGSAVFHWDCWTDVLNSSKIEWPYTFSMLEKDKVKEAEKTAEYFNSSDQVKTEGERIAEMLKSSKHAVVFTGAGISTASGIGDFRGKGGIWTEKARQKNYGTQRVPLARGRFSYNDLRPTFFHEAVTKLVQLGYIKYVISQNTDGLNRLSGIPKDKMSELHGNVFHERCEDCEARYERNRSVRSGTTRTGKLLVVPSKICKECGHDHRTGNTCEREGCTGYLMMTCINFRDSLETDVIESAAQEATKSDLMMSFGSSLRVTPACDLVTQGMKPLRLVVCNRQRTPFDSVCNELLHNGHQAGSRVFGDCDDVMKHVMRNILSPEELQEWDAGRDERMEEYAKKRS